jgi:spermidine/putrescine transport system ATP-binding protein
MGLCLRPIQPRSDIDVSQLTKIFGSGDDAVTALDAVDLHIPENEFFTLLGPSGCGKTTLLRMIAGFEEPTRGTILLGGSDIAGLPPNRRPVNTVFQSYALFPHMTVAQNIGFALRMLGKPRAEIEETVSAMLKLVRMESMAGRKPAQISGGQQQRVALARALAPRPRVLLLDEPLSALDLKLRKDMQVELKRLQAETGITFIFVTHDQEEALTMSDRIAVMNHGRVLQVGPPREIYNHPRERFVADFIGDTNFIAARVTGTENGKATVDFGSGRRIATTMPDGMSVAAGDSVTVVIRPEHAVLTEDGHLAGAVENIVYFGTDTNFHIRLDEGGLFTLRRQNAAWQEDLPEKGARVSIGLADGAVQIVRE